MRSDLVEYVRQSPTPDRLKRIADAVRMGRCPTTARQRTKTSPAEQERLILTVIELRAKSPTPSVREISELIGYGKSTIGRIVTEYGL